MYTDGTESCGAGPGPPAGHRDNHQATRKELPGDSGSICPKRWEDGTSAFREGGVPPEGLRNSVNTAENSGWSKAEKSSLEPFGKV